MFIAIHRLKEGKELNTNTAEKLVSYAIYFFLLFKTNIYLSICMFVNNNFVATIVGMTLIRSYDPVKQGTSQPSVYVARDATHCRIRRRLFKSRKIQTKVWNQALSETFLWG